MGNREVLDTDPQKIFLAADFVGPGWFFVVRKAEVCRIGSLAGFSSSVLLWIEQNWLCSSLKKTPILFIRSKKDGIN